MTQPSPAVAQLLNLADRSERHALTGPEAARLREGIGAMQADLDRYEEVQGEMNERAIDLTRRAEQLDDLGDQHRRLDIELRHWKTVIVPELAAERDQAQAALAALHEGEEPHGGEYTVPTPAQWIWHWNRATPAKRLEVAADLMSASERAHRCLMGNHENQLGELRERNAKLLQTVHERDMALLGWQEQLRKSRSMTAAHWAAIERVRKALDVISDEWHGGHRADAEDIHTTVRRIRDALDEHQEQ